MAKKQNFDATEEVVDEVKEEQVVEEPKKLQNEGKKLFSSVKETKGTRLS